MQNIGDKDERLVRYFLGELSAEERQSIEEQYFQDDKFFQEFLVIEGDLIDEYVRGELSAGERRKFESQVLSTPQGRQKVELSRALIRSLSEGAAKVVEDGTTEIHPTRWRSLWHRLWGKNRVWQLSFAVMTLLFIIGVAWLAVENRRLHTQLGLIRTSEQQKVRELQQLQEQAAAARQGQQQQETEWRANIQQLNDALERERAEREHAEELARQRLKQSLQQRATAGREPSTAIATYIFPFNSVRGTGQQGSPLVISAGQTTVRFRINLGRAAYPGYHISVQTVEGDEVWSQVVRKARHTTAGTSVTVNLPATIFTKRDYILIVTPSPANGQAESLAEYSFRVVRKD